MHDDRKAHRAALKQALLNSGISAGSNVLGNAVGVFRSVYENQAARERQRQQNVFAEKVLQRQQDFSSAQADRAYERSNPLINVPMGPGEVGPPRQDRLDTVTRLGHMQANMANARRSPMDELDAADAVGRRKDIEAIPGMPEGFAGRASQPGTPENALAAKLLGAEKNLADRGLPSLPGSLLPADREARDRDAVLKRFGAVIGSGADVDVINALAGQIERTGATPETPSYFDRVLANMRSGGFGTMQRGDWLSQAGRALNPVYGITRGVKDILDIDPPEAEVARRALLQLLLQAQQGELQSVPQLPENVRVFVDR